MRYNVNPIFGREDRMKKILFVIQSLRMGGAERVLVTIANHLAEMGYEVTIIIWMPYYVFRDNLDSRVKLIYKPHNQHLGNRIPYIRYEFYDGFMWLRRATPRQLYRYYVGRKKFDVEIAFFHEFAVDIVGGSTNRKSRKIAWIHNNLEDLDNEQKLEKAKKMFRKIKNIVCVSHASYDSFMKIIGDTGNVRVIHNPIPKEEILKKAQEPLEHKRKKAGFHLVMPARFHSPKGYHRLIEAVVRLRNEGKDISLMLAGEGSEESRIRDLVEENRAAEYIFVENGRNNPYPYIIEADLLVCASVKEGFNLTVAEALTLGVPVLTTDCRGPREILDGGKYGMIVENSGEGLYEGLKMLYEDPELLEYYRRKAVEWQAFYNSEKIFGQIADMIEG